MTAEPFGPLAPISPFRDMEDVIARANALEFRRADYGFANSLQRANEIAEAMEVGLIGLKTCEVDLPETPFGACEESGYGIEGASEGLEPYLVTPTVGQRRKPRNAAARRRPVCYHAGHRSALPRGHRRRPSKAPPDRFPKAGKPWWPETSGAAGTARRSSPGWGSAGRHSGRPAACPSIRRSGASARRVRPSGASPRPCRSAPCGTCRPS